MINELNNTAIHRDGLTPDQEKLAIELYSLAGFEMDKRYLDDQDELIGVHTGALASWAQDDTIKLISIQELAFHSELNPRNSDVYIDAEGEFCLEYNGGFINIRPDVSLVPVTPIKYVLKKENWSEQDEARQYVVSQNGNTGEHYEKTASDILKDGQEILNQRGKEYQQKQERSFPKVATAFNAITGHNLKSSEVCLLLQILKDVRQWENMERAHMDSLIDCVNYSALKAEEIINECKK